MIKNLKQFLIIALLILHSPHMSHADLGQAAVIGAWASGGAILCTLGAYNFWSTKHIITIEDPIEYIFEPKKSLIDQREVHEDTPDFESALKDPAQTTGPATYSDKGVGTCHGPVNY